MLKRKILAAVLPVVAAGTVVGSGFSAWYFGDISNKSINDSIGVEVTGASEGAGSVKILYNATGSGEELEGDELSGNKVLVLDQGTGSDRITSPNKGISFKFGDTILSTITFRYQINNEDAENLSAANITLSYDFSVAINDTLANYVVPQAATDGNNSYGWCSSQLQSIGNTYSVTGGNVNLTKGSKISYFDVTISLGVLGDQSNEFLLYKNKPENYEEYTKMRDALVAANLTSEPSTGKNYAENTTSGSTNGISFDFSVKATEATE